MATLYRYNRCDSLVMTGYPWITDTIVSHSDMIQHFGQNHIFKDFLLCLQRYEQNDLSKGDLLGVDLRKILHVKESQWSNTDNGDNAYKPAATLIPTKFFSYICANRLVDIASWVEGLPEKIKVPLHNKRSNIGKISFQKWSLLNDWPKLINQCRSLFIQNERDAPPNYGASINPEHQCFSLLSSIALRTKQTKAMKIASNIEIAAMHISIMWKGLLDFPDDIQWFRSQRNRDHIDANSMVFLEEVYRNSPHRFKLPLHLALMISPIILLIPNLLHTRDWDRHALLSTAKALGNQKPDSLLAAEKILWTLIFCIARGEKSFKDAMAEILALLPDTFLNGISPTDRHWFPTQDNTAVSAHRDTLLKSHEADIKGTISSEWPPLQLLNHGGNADTASSLQPSSTTTGDMAKPSSPAPVSSSNHVNSSGLNGTDESPDENLTDGDGGSIKSNTLRGDDECHTGAHDVSSGHLSTVPYATFGTIPNLAPTARLGLPSTIQPHTTKSNNLVPNEHMQGSGSPPEKTTESSAISPRRSSHNKVASAIEIDETTELSAATPCGSSAANPRRSARNKLIPTVDYSGNKPPTPRRCKGPPALSSKGERRSSLDPEAASSMETPIDNFDEVGSSVETPIDLAINTILSFYLQGKSPAAVTLHAPELPKQTFKCPSKTLYDPYCRKVASVMEFHSEARAQQFLLLIQAIEASFVDGTPLHSSNDKSGFFVTSDSQLKSHDLQRIHGKQHVLITEIPVRPLAFDECGLETLKSTEAVIDIYDFSYNIGVQIQSDESYRKTGTLSQMLKCADSQQPKILCTSEIPLGLSGVFPSFFSTDFHAWRKTEGDLFCAASTPYPADCMRWGLAATKGALRCWQLAPNGFGHYIDVQAGSILVVVARAKVGDHGRDPLSSIHLYGRNFNPQGHNADLWDLEAVVLSPGTRLILRPNTPYCYLFLENSICHGGRFYSTHTLQDTLVGIIHGFMLNTTVTGVAFSSPSVSRILLQRILYFYYHSFVVSSPENASKASHLPDLSDTKSALDFFSLYVIIVLLNVLEPKTYVHEDQTLEEYDQNILSLEERLACMFARGKAECLLSWTLERYDFIDTATGDIYEHPFEQIILYHLVRLEAAMLNYKQVMDQERPGAAASCTFTALENQLSSALCHFNNYHIATYRRKHDPFHQSLNIWIDWEQSHFKLCPKSKYVDVEGCSDINLIADGTNWSDSIYKRFHRIPDYLVHIMGFSTHASDDNPGNSPKRRRESEKEWPKSKKRRLA